MLRRKKRKNKKRERNGYAKLNVDKEVLYMSKINCKRKRTVEKANKGINVQKMIIGLKN